MLPLLLLLRFIDFQKQSLFHPLGLGLTWCFYFLIEFIKVVFLTVQHVTKVTFLLSITSSQVSLWTWLRCCHLILIQQEVFPTSVYFKSSHLKTFLFIKSFFLSPLLLSLTGRSRSSSTAVTCRWDRVDWQRWWKQRHKWSDKITCWDATSSESSHRCWLVKGEEEMPQFRKNNKFITELLQQAAFVCSCSIFNENIILVFYSYFGVNIVNFFSVW